MRLVSSEKTTDDVNEREAGKAEIARNLDAGSMRHGRGYIHVDKSKRSKNKNTLNLRNANWNTYGSWQQVEPERSVPPVDEIKSLDHRP